MKDEVLALVKAKKESRQRVIDAEFAALDKFAKVAVSHLRSMKRKGFTPTAVEYTDKGVFIFDWSDWNDRNKDAVSSYLSPWGTVGVFSLWTYGWKFCAKSGLVKRLVEALT